MKVKFVPIKNLSLELARREKNRKIDQTVHPLDLGKVIPKLEGYTLVPENVAESTFGSKDFFGIVQSKIRRPPIDKNVPGIITTIVEHKVSLPFTKFELKPDEVEKLKEHLLSAERLPKEVIAASIARMQKSERSEFEKLEKMQEYHSDLIKAFHSWLFSNTRK